MTAVESHPKAVDTEPKLEPGAPEIVTFEQRAAAVDDALKAVDELDGDAKDAAIALKDAVEAFHREALVHIVKTLKDDANGKPILFDLVDDPSVRAVLGLHGIIKPDPMVRAKVALDTVRPYLQSHGGDVELVRIAEGAAFVRLQGSCNGCSMSAVTLREGVEEALVKGVEEIDRVEVLEDQPTAAFIPLSAVGKKTADTGWVAGPSADEVPEGEMLRFDIDTGLKEADSFVVTNVENRFAVFRNACVHQGLTLDGGMMDDGVIICPWHGFKFEASSGECISAPGAQLEQVPTRVEDGKIWVRVAD